MKQDNKSHLFKHVHSIATGFDWYNYLFFKIIDKANSNCFCLFVCLFLFLFHLLFLLSLMLIIGIFYCLNFTLLLLHFITRHLVLHLSFFICYFQNPCTNHRHILLSWLHFVITSSLYNTSCNRFYNNYVVNIYPRQLLWFN